MNTKGEYLWKTWNTTEYLVAIIFLVNISTPTIANAKNNVVNRYTVKDEHHIYKVQVTDKGKKHIVTAIQTDSNDKIIITTTKKKIKINYCKYIGKNTFGIKKYKHTTKTILKHKTKKTTTKATTTGYNLKKSTIGCDSNGNKYWYKLGNGKDSNYIEVGCIASYKVNISENKTDVTNFTSAVNEAASCYKKSCVEIGAGAVLDIVGLLCEFATLGLGSGIAASLIISSVGCTAASVSNIAEFNQHINDAAIYYEIVKKHGTMQ